MTDIVDGLFCAIATLGEVPVIKCPRGGATEHVAAALDTRIRDYRKNKTGVFPEHSQLHRPLLVLFERNFDLATALA